MLANQQVILLVLIYIDRAVFRLVPLPKQLLLQRQQLPSVFSAGIWMFSDGRQFANHVRTAQLHLHARQVVIKRKPIAHEDATLGIHWEIPA